MVCGESKASASTCRGDGGGPFTVVEGPDRDQHYLVGVNSWQFGCAEPNKQYLTNFPTVYTEVSSPAVRNWIDAAIAREGGAFFCYK